MNASAVLPERIGRFRIRAMLGGGAMSTVYLAQDEEIDRLVVVKLIHTDRLETEQRARYLRQLRDEARIAGRCLHATIVGLHDFILHGETPVLVMEHVRGIGLQRVQPRGGRRPVHEVIHIALQVLDALHYAHARSILHRDIRPSRILVMPDLSLKLAGLGVSPPTSTPSAYSAPEQILRSPLDGRADLFALACMLYELAAGEHPFAGTNRAGAQLVSVDTTHVPLSARDLDLPPGFSDAIDTALARSPDGRHASAASFARVLDSIARDARLPRRMHPPSAPIRPVSNGSIASEPPPLLLGERFAQPRFAVPAAQADAQRSHIVGCLAAVLAPIAPVLARAGNPVGDHAPSRSARFNTLPTGVFGSGASRSITERGIL